MTLVRRRFQGLFCSECEQELQPPWWRNPWFWVGFRSAFDITGNLTRRDMARLQAAIPHNCPALEARRQAHRDAVLDMCESEELRSMLARFWVNGTG